VKKLTTMRASGDEIFKGRKLMIGLDLGDRSSNYCILDETGEVLLEHKLATTPEAMKRVFGGMPRSRIALETGAHSPWVSRLVDRVRPRSDRSARAECAIDRREQSKR
jgi:hypothetical protein